MITTRMILTLLALAVAVCVLFVLLVFAVFAVERSRTFMGGLALGWWRLVERLRRRGGPRT
jgi:hypothetical protein